MVDAEKTWVQEIIWGIHRSSGREHWSSGSIPSLISLGFDMSHSDLLFSYFWVLGKDLIDCRPFSFQNLTVLRVHVILRTATGFKMAV